MSHSPDILPDQLSKDLDIVFVGTAAGKHSARAKAYYAHPGNKFWRTLFAVGLTPALLSPADYPAMLTLGFGFTDLCKTQAGGDHEVDAFNRKRLERAVKRYRPRALAFTSKKGASLWYGQGTEKIGYGQQPKMGDGPEIFVLPSPSGRAAAYWDAAPWRDLARWHSGRDTRGTAKLKKL